MNSRYLLTLFVSVLLFSCTITKVNEVKTGLFGNDLEKLSAAYERVDQLERGKATRKDVEKILEIEFQKRLPSNVERVPGPQTFRRVFGDNVFHGALAELTNKPDDIALQKKIKELLFEMNRYRAYFIPFKNITAVSDRFYFSRKENHRQGDDLSIVIVFRNDGKNDVLFYGDYQYVKIDSKDSESAFAQGILEILQQYVGPSRALYDFLKDVQDKNKD